ncbi:DUF563 domain-containing protein [Mucilaginibacter sp.]|uniref:glycosyltransferase family 61 protein n=1 Tax=Mucilaginibacter sp. TaxID=1882438 RepID=UPI0035BC031D
MLKILSTNFRDLILAILRKSATYRKFFFVPRAAISLPKATGIKAIYTFNESGISRVPPLTNDPAPYWKFKMLLHAPALNTFVLDADKYRVWGNQGAVITASGYLLREVSREFEKKYHSIFKQLRLIRPVRLKGTSAIISASGADMYYHWMFDIIPRIRLLRQAGFEDRDIDHYIVDYRDLPFQRESLALLGIAPEKISRSTDHFAYHITADRLIVPSLPSALDEVSAEACRFLKEIFFTQEPAISPFGDRIYLKRSGKRVIINEAEIETFLHEQGFETVHCDHYTIAEQATIFHHARVIAGSHGAAFSNVVFCQPEAQVIEFFSPRWINPCYWTICNHTGATYYYLVGEGSVPNSKSDAQGTAADITLDVQKLHAFFNQFNITK